MKNRVITIMNQNASLKLGGRGLALIKHFESFVAYPYDDLLPPVGGKYREWTGGLVRGTLTIGYGHTEAAGPPRISKGMRITEDEASLLLDADLDRVEQAVRNVVTSPLEQHQYDALVSFHYNTGSLTKTRAITQWVNRGEHKLAMQQLEMFRTAKGQVLAGLVRRRAAERALYEGRFERVAELTEGDVRS